MKAIANTLVALTFTAVLVGFGAIGGATEAAAGTTKPMLKVEGKPYYQKKKAKSSAIYNWEQKAKAKHNTLYNDWGLAKKTSFDCKRKTHQGNAKKLWTCQAKGKPSALVIFCKVGKVKAKWAHQNEAGAKAGARDVWGKKAAAKHVT